MSEEQENLQLSPGDVEHHVVKYGLDVYPPIDVRNETTRANALFQSLMEWKPELYQKLDFAPQANQIAISTPFPVPGVPGGSIECLTLTFTQRGPVFAFPLRLPPPVNELTYQGREGDAESLFAEALQGLRRTFPGLKVLRLGLVRELVFSTGQMDCTPYIASRFGGFEKAQAFGGDATVTFVDDHCNIRVRMQSVVIQRRIKSKVAGLLSDEQGHGLKVDFDVNNREMKPQTEADMENTLTRGRSLWPEGLIGFLNWRA